jgi:cation-transporting ATPase 13A3/4/5
LFLSIVSNYSTVRETRANNETIRGMARYICDVEVLRNGQYNSTEWVKVPSDTLVPGDIIKVPETIVLPCDLLVLQGSCIVNEAILTGESIPVMKSPLPNVNHETYSVGECSKYTLFGGTFVI